MCLCATIPVLRGSRVGYIVMLGMLKQDRVAAALNAAGIKTWELFRVDNNSDGTGAPLDILERDAAKQPLARA